MDVDPNDEGVDVKPDVLLEISKKYTNAERTVPHESDFFPEGPSTFWFSLFLDG